MSPTTFRQIPFFSQRANTAEGGARARGAPSGNLAGHRHERRRARLQHQACVWNRPGTVVGTAGGRVGSTSQAHRQRWPCFPRPGLYLARPRPNGVAAKPTGSGRKTTTRGDALRGDSTRLAHQDVSLGRWRVRCLHDFAFSPPLCLMQLQLQWNASGRSALGVTGLRHGTAHVHVVRHVSRRGCVRGVVAPRSGHHVHVDTKIIFSRSVSVPGTRSV